MVARAWNPSTWVTLDQKKACFRKNNTRGQQAGSTSKITTAELGNPFNPSATVIYKINQSEAGKTAQWLKHQLLF